MDITVQCMQSYGEYSSLYTKIKECNRIKFPKCKFHLETLSCKFKLNSVGLSRSHYGESKWHTEAKKPKNNNLGMFQAAHGDSDKNCAPVFDSCRECMWKQQTY